MFAVFIGDLLCWLWCIYLWTALGCVAVLKMKYLPRRHGDTEKNWKQSKPRVHFCWQCLRHPVFKLIWFSPCLRASVVGVSARALSLRFSQHRACLDPKRDPPRTHPDQSASGVCRQLLPAVVTKPVLARLLQSAAYRTLIAMPALPRVRQRRFLRERGKGSKSG